MLYLSEADPYESLRAVVHPALASLPAEELEAVLRLHGVEAEGWNDLVGAMSQFGSQIGQRMPAIGQGALQGAAMGAAAGPYGALLGALGGAVAGGLTAPATPAARPGASQPPPAPQPVAAPPPAAPALAPTPPQPSAPAQPAAAPVAPAGASPAATQLLALLPQLVQALSAMSLGSAGARTIDVAGTAVPVAAVPAAASVLANQAASEYAEAFGDEAAIDHRDAAETAEAVVRPLPRRRPSRPPRTAPELVWVERATYEQVYA